MIISVNVCTVIMYLLMVWYNCSIISVTSRTRLTANLWPWIWLWWRKISNLVYTPGSMTTRNVLPKGARTRHNACYVIYTLVLSTCIRCRMWEKYYLIVSWWILWEYIPNSVALNVHAWLIHNKNYCKSRNFGCYLKLLCYRCVSVIKCNYAINKQPVDKDD